MIWYIVTEAIPPDPDHKIFIQTGKAPEAKRYSIYSPFSVTRALHYGIIDNYFNNSESYEALEN